MDIKDIPELIELCRKKGVKNLKFGDFSIELDSQALFPESAYKRNKKEKQIEAIQDPVPNALVEAEKALFWSSGIDMNGASQ